MQILRRLGANLRFQRRLTLMCVYRKNTHSLSTEAMAGCQKLDPDNVKSFLDSVDTIMTDCDGVLWHGSKPVEGVPETVQKLQSMGKKFFYVTNNSTKTRGEYVKKCNQLGYQADKEDIICTAHVAAEYLKHKLKFTGKAYVVGSTGITQELDEVGIPHNGIPDDSEGVDNMTRKDLENIKLDPEVGCVVVGFDDHFNYVKMFKAMNYLARDGCLFVATNMDSGLPMGNGKFAPGTGAVVTAVSFASQRTPDVVCGKPNKPMIDMLQLTHKIDPARTLMIGDRLNTDIMFGHNCGFRTLLVLTGFSNLDEVRRNQASNSIEHQKQIPHYYLPTLADLGKMIEDVYPQ